MVVNTCAFIEAARQESVDTVLALADTRRDGARLVVTGCMAERYGDELAEALPEVDLVAPFGVSLTGPPAPAAAPPGATPHSGTPVVLGRKPTRCRPVVRPVEPAPPAIGGTVVVHQGGRGMRPQLWLLRHPVVPGQAALPLHRVDPGRGGPAGRPRRPAPGGGPGGPGPVLVRPRPLHRPDRAPAGRPGDGWPPPDRRPGGGGGPPGRLGPAALPLSVHAGRRPGRGRPGHRSPVLRPLPAARLAPPAQTHAAVGRGGPVPRPHRLHPGRRADGRLPLVVHRGLPGGDRGRPRPAPRLAVRRPAGLGGVLPVQQRGRHARCRPPRPDRHRPGGRAAPRVHRGAGRHHRPAAGRAAGRHRRGPGRRARRGPDLPGGTGDRRHRVGAGRPAGRVVRRGGGDRGRRPRPAGRAGPGVQCSRRSVPWPCRPGAHP